MNQLQKTESNLSVQKFETAGDVLAAQVKAHIEARYIIAERNPRDMGISRKKLLDACERPYFAEKALYHKPVGEGKVVDGPSIRFAEEAVNSMGNFMIETLAIYDDHEKRILKITVIDMENNASYSQDISIMKTVERKKPRTGETIISKRANSKNEIVYLIEANEENILNKQNAYISKVIRTLGLRLVPGDIIEEALETVKKTQMKKDKKNPKEANKKIFDAFGQIGVSPKQIQEFLKIKTYTIDPENLQKLRGLYQAIRDGETTWKDIIETADIKTNGKGKPDVTKPTLKETEAEPAEEKENSIDDIKNDDYVKAMENGE